MREQLGNLKQVFFTIFDDLYELFVQIEIYISIHEWLFSHILGELTASILSDIYGRKWVHILSYFFIIALGVGLSYAQNFLTFIIVRSFVAVFTGVS